MSNLFISSDLLEIKQRGNVFDLVAEFSDRNLGIEVFPMLHEPEWMNIIEEESVRLKNIPVSFHEPYHMTDHSALSGTTVYKRTEEYCDRVLAYAESLDAIHITCHHNNRSIDTDELVDMRKTSQDNLSEYSRKAKDKGQTIFIENAGTVQQNNCLFDESSFIGLFDATEIDCLIDIGHANCNGWNIEETIRSLQKRIRAYHIHNNNGIDDSHSRIHDGNIDFDDFFRLYALYTPGANLVLEYDGAQLLDMDGVREDIEWVYSKMDEVFSVIW